jgi:CO dehydrogenase maturation factor
MKIAVAGKGGVGKTTLTSLLAYAFAEQGRRVLALDGDPSPCLGDALGFPEELLRGLTPIADMKDFVEQRTGVKPDGAGGYVRLNPKVDDVSERFAAVHRGIHLLELGAADRGGAGCICAGSALLRRLVAHLFEGDGVVLLDMYAGVEHLGRGTTDAVDAMVVVAEPTARSLATAAQIRSLAEDVGLDRLYLVGSKVASADDRAFIESRSPRIPVAGHLGADAAVGEADRARRPVRDLAPRLFAEALEIAAALSDGCRDRQ